jgi:hypothetical protein
MLVSERASCHSAACTAPGRRTTRIDQSPPVWAGSGAESPAVGPATGSAQSVLVLGNWSEQDSDILVSRDSDILVSRDSDILVSRDSDRLGGCQHLGRGWGWGKRECGPAGGGRGLRRGLRLIPAATAFQVLPLYRFPLLQLGRPYFSKDNTPMGRTGEAHTAARRHRRARSAPPRTHIGAQPGAASRCRRTALAVDAGCVGRAGGKRSESFGPRSERPGLRMTRAPEYRSWDREEDPRRCTGQGTPVSSPREGTLVGVPRGRRRGRPTRDNAPPPP